MCVKGVVPSKGTQFFVKDVNYDEDTPTAGNYVKINGLSDIPVPNQTFSPPEVTTLDDGADCYAADGAALFKNGTIPLKGTYSAEDAGQGILRTMQATQAGRMVKASLANGESFEIVAFCTEFKRGVKIGDVIRLDVNLQPSGTLAETPPTP